MIEGGEHAGNMKGLIVGGRIRAPQAKVPGGQSHGREDGDQVHLDDANAVPDSGSEIVPVAVRHGEPIIAERQMELALFEGPGNALKVGGREEVRRGGRMTP
jgi:hypothetical protein